MKWPNCFINGTLPEDTSKENLVATALEGWELACFTLCPDNFGKSMALIGEKLGVIPTPDNINKEADKILNKEL